MIKKLNKRIKRNFVIFAVIIAVLGSSMAVGTNAQAANVKYVTKTVYKTKYLGKYRVTYYSESGGNRTASGKKPKVGRTIAVNRRYIKLGTKVKVGKKWYVAEDTGGALRGKRKIVDIYVKSERIARKLGVKKLKVYVKVKTKKKVAVPIKKAQYLCKTQYQKNKEERWYETGSSLFFAIKKADDGN